MSAQVERGFAEGWIQARIPETRTGLSVAVIGSGPAGLACADVLNQQGHKVTVYEREDRPGGLLMYGIPNMKLDKGKVERRINLLEEEGIEFVCNAEIGKSIAEVIEQLSGEVPTEEMVEAVTNRLKMAQESGEAVDIAEIVSSMNAMAAEWA